MKYLKAQMFNLVFLLLTCTLAACAVVTSDAKFSGSQPVDDAWVSPVSLSANAQGIRITPKIMEQFLINTEFSRSEIENLGLKEGELSEDSFQKLIDANLDRETEQYVGYFDRRFNESNYLKYDVWERISNVQPFIEDAIKYGDYSEREANDLESQIKLAAMNNDKDVSLNARNIAYQYLLRSRRTAIRKARGYRQIIEILNKELQGRYFNSNLELVVEVRTNVIRPTIAPRSIVTVACLLATYETLYFNEKYRECGEFGVCRINSIAEFGGVDSKFDVQTPDEKNANLLFVALRDEGRSFLDQCTINIELLIDGERIIKFLPGKFTSINN